MGQRRMLTHPLKAWSLDEWGMPTASTGASTSSGADYCWWLRARWVTIWCSNDLRALRSVGCPAPPLGSEGSFLVDFVTEYSYPSRKIEQKGGFVLWKEEGTLDGTLQEFRGLDSSHLAQVAILVQTITSEFFKWTGRCCLYPLALSGIAVVGWELSPLPST